MNAYQLLSEIYRLLGDIDQETLSAAERQAISPEIRAIVKALRNAHSPTKRSTTKTAQPSYPSPSFSVEIVREPDNEPKAPSKQPVLAHTNGSEPLEAILSEARGVTNEQLARMMARSGLPIHHRPKESRRDLVGRASRLLRLSPPDKQTRVLNALKKLVHVDETAGWMELIHPSNRQ